MATKKMMKTIKTSEATNIQLDWLVWVCAGGAAAYPKTASGKAFLKLWHGNSAKYVHTSTDWAQGGPIIEREKLRLTTDDGGEWWGEARLYRDGRTAYTTSYDRAVNGRGPTPLIAAARCYVTSKLGDTVEVPEELT